MRHTSVTAAGRLTVRPQRALPRFLVCTLLSLLCSPGIVDAQAIRTQADNDLDGLKRIGTRIAQAVLEKDWETLIDYEAVEFRTKHKESLKDQTSDLYCFLVDSTCRPGHGLQPSVFEQLSRARDLGITTSDLGKSRTDGNGYVALVFYDRDAMSEQLASSPKFYCRPENFKKVVFWTFKSVHGKWEEAT